MIGNDVIDLKQTRVESNWQRKGFLQKLFTLDEQLLIATSSNSEMTVWLLWSMKEAAYKIYNRQTSLRKYIPKKLICTIIYHNNTIASGHVFCEGRTYYTKSYLSPNSIHTMATALLVDLDRVVEIEKKNVIKDSNGIPYVVTEPGKKRQAVSISHHGRFEKVVAIETNKTNYFIMQ